MISLLEVRGQISENNCELVDTPSVWPTRTLCWPLLFKASLFLNTVYTWCLAGEIVKVVGRFSDKLAHDESGEGVDENEWEQEEEEEKEEDVEEEYLQTANWQLGNRRVRCHLMSDTRKRERKEVETHLHRMDCLHTLPSGFVLNTTLTPSVHVYLLCFLL